MRCTLVGMGLAMAVLAPDAQAGAWPAPPEGQAIWTAAASEGGEAALHLEAPFGADTSLVISPWIELSPSGDEWRTETVVAAKRVFGRTDTAVFAIQAGAYWQSEPPDQCGEGGFEGRWLGGVSLGRTGFANLEAAGRVLEGGCVRWRLDLSAGVRPAEQWLAMAQVFYDDQDDGGSTVKGQLSITRFGRSGRGFQLGVRVRLDGEDPEPALVLGYWAPSARR